MILSCLIEGRLQDADTSVACSYQDFVADDGRTACAVICSGGHVFSGTYHENVIWFDSSNDFKKELAGKAITQDEWEKDSDTILHPIVGS